MGDFIEVPTSIFLFIAAMLTALMGIHVYGSFQPKYVPASVLARDAVKSVVIVECHVGDAVAITAGTVISDRGHIATVAHGIVECKGKNSKNLFVRFWKDPNKAYRASILRMSQDKDAAILQVPLMPKDVEPLDIDMSIQPIGGRALTIGHPDAYFWSVADGIVSADRFWKDPFRHLIQISTPINHGNSGGPVLNNDGRVIGAVSFGVPGSDSINFIVPMDTFAAIAQGIYF